ncbi:unnamed protein product [marine sediment metagenome]|uniref:Uncharacterized protein n=1 Tax=marine sediment metagenome TaxID=412755 RepID=X0UFM8_9ZZZZ
MCLKSIWNWLKSLGISESDIQKYLPFDTEEVVKAFIENEFGLSCEGQFFSTIPADNKPDKYGYYGTKGTEIMFGEKKIVNYTSMVECRIITGNTGYTKFKLEMDPNNGWIQKFFVKKEFIQPEWADKLVPKRLPTSENPNYETYLGLI